MPAEEIFALLEDVGMSRMVDSSFGRSQGLALAAGLG